MRTLKNLGYPQDSDVSSFPDGQIQNETPTQEGTPVVREIYGDVLTNIYKILRDSGINANEIEDSENTSYQLLDALKKFANELNDLEQILTITINEIQANFNIDNLPLNYVFIARNSDIIKEGTNYSFVGTGTKVLTFSTTKNIEANSLLIVTLKGSSTSIVAIPELSSSTTPENFILTPFAGVLSYNSTSTTYYLSDGYVINNTPVSGNVEQAIRVYESNSTINIIDAVIHKGKLFVMAKSIDLNVYDFYKFDLSNLELVEAKMTYSQLGTTDFVPYLYADESFIYLTNNGNNSTSDNIIDKINVDYTTNTLSKTSEITLDTSFQKTSNAVWKNGEIYTFVNGNLNLYRVDGTFEFLLFINNVNGQLFKQGDKIYFTSGEISTIWNV